MHSDVHLDNTNIQKIEPSKVALIHIRSSSQKLNNTNAHQFFGAMIEQRERGGKEKERSKRNRRSKTRSEGDNPRDYDAKSALKKNTVVSVAFIVNFVPIYVSEPTSSLVGAIAKQFSLCPRHCSTSSSDSRENNLLALLTYLLLLFLFIPYLNPAFFPSPS